MKTLRKFSITICSAAVIFWVGMMYGSKPVPTPVSAHAISGTISHFVPAHFVRPAAIQQTSTSFQFRRVLVGEPQWGLASYYGGKDRFFWKKRADKTLYDPDDYFVANREFDLGTVLWVCNPRNRRCLNLPVKDRGPYIGDRKLDLSSRAADYLDIKGPGVVYLSYQKEGVERVGVSR